LGTLIDSSSVGNNNLNNSQTLISPTITRDKKNYSTLDVDTSRYYGRPTPGDTFRLDPQRMKQF
jgi:hypothetical protein